MTASTAGHLACYLMKKRLARIEGDLRDAAADTDQNFDFLFGTLKDLASLRLLVDDIENFEAR